MRTRIKIAKPTYFSIRRHIRFQEIEQKIIERDNLPYAETKQKLLDLTKPFMHSKRIFNEEGC